MPHVSTSEYWWANCDETLEETQELLLYSSVNDYISHIAVQLQHNDRFSNYVFFIDCMNSTAVDGLKKCTEVMYVAT